MRLSFKASPALVKSYFRLFVNRRAYTVQSMKPNPESGRHYYYRPMEKPTGKPVRLIEETIRKHLEGDLTIALYAINPATQRCKWVAIDADYKDAIEDLLKLQYYLAQDGVEAALEMSRRGGHLWIFLAQPLLARECRIYIFDQALRLGMRIKGAGLAEGIEVFPKHDELKAGEFGNAMRGPLGIHRASNRRYWFYGADYTLEKQMAYLERLRKVTEPELHQFIAGKSIPAELTGQCRNSIASGAYDGSNGREFRILNHIGSKLRKLGRNYVTQCPSCADSGHDHGADNLSIRIDDPRFYKCWAGCTKEMIRDAVGCPIRYPHPG